MGANWNSFPPLYYVWPYPTYTHQMYALELSCWLPLSSLDQSSSEQVIDIIASRNFAAVQTASGKVGGEGREGGRENGWANRRKRGRGV